MSNYKTFYGEQLYPQDKEENLKTYVYKGADHSYIYRYFYSPIAQFLVDHVIPPYVA